MYTCERGVHWAKNVNGQQLPAITTTKPGYFDIANKLSSSNTTNNTNNTSYPPSPPAAAALPANVVGTSTELLTLANVAAIPASFSTISTSPASDDSFDSASDVSFASSAASSVASTQSFLNKVFGAESAAELARHGVKVSSINDEEDEQVDSAAAAEMTVGAVDEDEQEESSVTDNMDGAILESIEHNTKTLYCSPALEKLDREGLVDLMERADEDYECSGIVICMDKKDALLEETLHSLLYVGGSIVPPDAGLLKVSEDILMVGLDL